jgi:acetyl-CoA hydrolase
VGESLTDVELVHLLTFAPAPYTAPEFDGIFRHNALFIGTNVRRAVNEGRADHTPTFLFEVPRLFRDRILPLDVALVSLSPPDEAGYCTFGVEVGATKPAAEAARLIIAEVNQQMPRTNGDTLIHVSQLQHIIEVDRPLPDTPQPKYTPLYAQIGQHIAKLIPNGATLQIGLGSIPAAVLKQLGHHQDLGIHTELFSDGIIDLVEAGVITGARKTLHRGKIVAGFLFGSQRLYHFATANKQIALYPSDYVNNPSVIAQNEQMVAINGALQIDLTGQVCADSVGTKLYSGAGGQVDFIRGAAQAKAGKPIITLPATAKNQTVSRIVPTLDEGAGVVTTRNDVHYVVTEYGVAALHGKTIRQRAQALIQIAHPDFRDRLTWAARQLQYF